MNNVSYMNTANANGAGSYSASIVGGQAMTSGYSWQQPYYYHYTTTAIPSNKDMEMRLVDNGFIVTRLGKEYVFSSTKALTEWIEKEFKQGKK